MTVATQLSIYNGACAVMGERQLQSATENRESRRVLDDIWTRGAVGTCLAAGLWHFASRGIQWNYDSTLQPAWGYQCVFQLPSDWVRWMVVSVDPYMETPLLQYTTENSNLYCDLQQLWVKYVSNDPRFGMNMAFWPDNFQRYVEAYFGAAAALRVTGSREKEKDAIEIRDKALKKAKSTDAMNEASRLIPAGSWRQARHGRRGPQQEQGNPNSLYG